MQLLERESALASLAGYAREAGQGDGRLVLVAGEPGVGKSALVERLECDLPGARWSWGACESFRNRLYRWHQSEVAAEQGRVTPHIETGGHVPLPKEKRQIRRCA